MSLGSPPPQPSPPPHRTNWAAVSALAACGGVFVAFLTYAIPHSPAPQPPATYTATPTQPATAGQSSQRNAPGPFGNPDTVVPTAGPAEGCQPVNAAIKEYQTTVGPSWYSRADAAMRAENEIEMAIAQSGGEPTPDMEAVLNDFQALYAAAQGHASTRYDEVADQTNTDISAFRSSCHLD